MFANIAENLCIERNERFVFNSQEPDKLSFAKNSHFLYFCWLETKTVCYNFTTFQEDRKATEKVKI